MKHFDKVFLRTYIDDIVTYMRNVDFYKENISVLERQLRDTEDISQENRDYINSRIAYYNDVIQKENIEACLTYDIIIENLPIGEQQTFHYNSGTFVVFVVKDKYYETEHIYSYTIGGRLLARDAYLTHLTKLDGNIVLAHMKGV